MDMVSSELVITASEFKAKCLDIFKRINDGRLRKVIVTRRGKVVAEIGPPMSDKANFLRFLGSMKGSVTVPDGVDLVAPIFDGEINAEQGILYVGQ